MVGPTGHERRDAGIPQYLNLNSLSLSQLPPHPDFPASVRDHQVSLSQFLNNLIAEVGRVKLNEDFTHHGTWAPKDAESKLEPCIRMPPPSRRDFSESATNPVRNRRNQDETVTVPIVVQKWVKRMNGSSWLGRSSHHLGTQIQYEELDQLLSQDHGHKEARYTPNLYDTNELLAWSPQDLENAVAELTCTERAESAQMSIFQMFHKMPRVAGFKLLNDRVFHVLVVTLHSRFVPPNHDGTVTRRQSITVQLPIDFDSFRSVETIMQRSHLIKKGSCRYYVPRSSPQHPITAKQQERKGNKLVEGNYVSLEHVHEANLDWDAVQSKREAPTQADTDYCHEWRMMTLSIAGGVTRYAPHRTQMKETLEAISGDVYEAIECIQKDRSASLGKSIT
ncbi:hypothetical protein J1614_011874 [Plenodomus biglobosus]|nr:hypothetical protein J1614_011874 [Plenodomus biglobosus]